MLVEQQVVAVEHENPIAGREIMHQATVVPYTADIGLVPRVAEAPVAHQRAHDLPCPIGGRVV